MPSYQMSANEKILTIVQIESVLGLQNVKEIAAVDGIGKLRLP